MKYEHVIEERNYNYGDGQKFKTKDELKEYLRLERGKILTNVSLAGYSKAVEIVQQEYDDSIKIRVIITYPVELLPA